MNLMTVKKDSDIKLTAVIAEVERKDGHAVAVTIKDPAGGMLIVRAAQYSGIDVLVPAPPKMVDRWQVKGAIKGVKFSELFELEHQADARARELDLPAADYTIAKVSIEDAS